MDLVVSAVLFNYLTVLEVFLISAAQLLSLPILMYDYCTSSQQFSSCSGYLFLFYFAENLLRRL